MQSARRAQRSSGDLGQKRASLMEEMSRSISKASPIFQKTVIGKV